jgi:hypothetical protein
VTPPLFEEAASQVAFRASWRASPALRMLMAALTSAWVWWPQVRHRNSRLGDAVPRCGVAALRAPL